MQNALLPTNQSFDDAHNLDYGNDLRVNELVLS